MTLMQNIASAIINLTALVSSFTGLIIALDAHRRVAASKVDIAATKADIAVNTSDISDLQTEVRNGNGDKHL